MRRMITALVLAVIRCLAPSSSAAQPPASGGDAASAGARNATPSDGTLIEHITFKNLGKGQAARPGNPNATYPVRFGSTVKLALDKEALRNQLTPQPRTGESLVKGYEDLKAITRQLTELQTAYAAFQRLYAQHGNVDHPDVSRASAQVAELGKAAIQSLIDLEKTAPVANPALHRALTEAATRFIPADDDLAQGEIRAGRPLSAAALRTQDETPEKPYATLINVLGATAVELERSLSSDLTRHIESSENRVEITLTAEVIPHRGRGGATALPVPGYYDAPEGTPLPIPQFATVVDARTAAEVAAARDWIAVVRDFNKPNGLGTQARTAYEDARTRLNTLARSLEEIAIAQFDRVLADLDKAIKDPPEGSQVERLRQLRDQFQQLRNLMANTPVLPPGLAYEKDDVQLLIGISNAFRAAASGLLTLKIRVPTLLGETETVVNAILGNSAQELKDAALKAINDTRAELTSQESSITALSSALRETADKLGFAGELGRRALILDQYLRRLSLDELVDTSIAVRPTTLVDVEPGDEVLVTIRAVWPASDAGGKPRVTTEEQRLRVERYGLYSEWRGALLFVDQRSNRTRDTSFQPVPALGYQFRFGSEAHRRLLPSPGFSVALLDFSDRSDLEIGLAGNVTMLDDMLWSGFGYNLQAKAQYFYVGLNVLQVVNSLRRQF